MRAAIPKVPKGSRKRTRPHRRKGVRTNLGTGSMMPLPQQAEAKKLYAEGKTISEISRELKRDWKTIAKVVRTEDMERYLDEMEKRVAEMIPDALNTLQGSLKVGKHKAQLSYGLVRDYILRRRQRVAPILQTAALTPAGIEAADEEAVKKMIAGFTETVIATHKIFNIPMPELEQVDRATTKKKVELRMAV